MRHRSILLIAAATYVSAWMLPSFVMPGPFGVVVIYRGWDATRVALDPLWPGGFEIEGWLAATLSVLSGLSNLVFVTAWLLAARWPERIRFPLEAALWLSVAVNLGWLSEGSGLRAGYFLWLAAFVLLAWAVHAVRRGHRPPHSPLPAA